MKKTSLILGLALLAGCDQLQQREARAERQDGTYRAAMADLESGRIDEAIKGFEKTVVRDPANAEARFQLAYVLQDARKDYAGAYRAFAEYLQQQPKSDKAAMAEQRLRTCEKELAKLLAEKYALNNVKNLTQSVDTLKGQLEISQQRLASMEKDMTALLQRNRSLNAERERLLGIVKGGEIGESMAPSKQIAKDAKALLEETDEESTDRVKASDDFAKLKADEKSETATDSPSLLPARTAEDLARRKAREEQEAKERAQRAEEEARLHPPHPATYVVQEGDTLFKIALRFYHRTSAWRMIRDANKAVISNDGRVRTGDEIKLP